MSLAVITIDTATQHCSMTVDGVPMVADEIEFYYGTDYNGNPVKEFKYVMTTTLPDGGTQDMEYQMMALDTGPNVQDQGPGVGGLVSREIKTKDRLYKEVEAFVNESNAAVKVMNNGPTNTPYCVMLNGKAIKCYADMKSAQDHMNRMGG